MPESEQVSLDAVETLVAAHGAEVVVAQTTFASVRVAGRLLRISYERKVEGSIAPRHVRAVRFASEHELLIEYRLPISDLLIASAPDRPEIVEERLQQATHDMFHGWRDARHFANPVLGSVLRDGFGLVLRGPEPLVENMERVLVEHGARTQRRAAARKPRPDLMVFTADRGFVIAHGFRATEMS